MTRSEISALEQASRMSTVWAPEGYDGRTHFRAVATALAPALFILSAAATVLFSVI